MKSKPPKSPLTTNANFERVHGETILCKDHMRETVPYDGAEQCVCCGSTRWVTNEHGIALMPK